MILNFEYEKLKNILINLYNITKVRTVIYDSTFEKIASFPENSCMFCEMVKSEEKTRLMCKKMIRMPVLLVMMQIKFIYIKRIVRFEKCSILRQISGRYEETLYNT